MNMRSGVKGLLTARSSVRLQLEPAYLLVHDENMFKRLFLREGLHIFERSAALETVESAYVSESDETSSNMPLGCGAFNRGCSRGRLDTVSMNRAPTRQSMLATYANSSA